MANRPTAVVTGASRGIGKAIAVALSGAGYDVAITARTVHEGQPPDAGEGLTDAPLPGSLDTTAAAVEAAGGRAVPIRLDLLDRAGLMPAAEACLAALGHVDVLVNNAIYVGPGNQTRFLDTPWSAVDDRLFANLAAQLAFTRPILASMVERGSGVIATVTSGAGYTTPPAPPGEGGWGIAYSASKAGVNRIAVQLAVEYGDQGIRAYSLQPGAVLTERVAASGEALEFVARHGAPPEAVGAAVVAVLDDLDAFPNGSIVELPDVMRDRGLLGRGPTP